MPSFTGADILRVLTQTKHGAEASIAPGLLGRITITGGAPLPDGCCSILRPAEERPGTYSWWLVRAIGAFYHQIITDVYAFTDDRGHRIIQIISKSSPGRLEPNRMLVDLDAPRWYPGFFPAYLVGLQAIAVALAIYAEAITSELDPLPLVSALAVLLKAEHEHFEDAIALASDELYYFLRSLLLPHIDTLILDSPFSFPGPLHPQGANLANILGSPTVPTAPAPPKTALATPPDPVPLPEILDSASEPKRKPAAHRAVPREPVPTPPPASSTRALPETPPSWAAPWENIPSDLAFKGMQAYAELSIAVDCALPTFLAGPTGTGKNTLVHEVLSRHKLQVHTLKGSYGLQDIDILGAVMPAETGGDGGPAYHWVDGPLAAGWRHAQKEKVAVFFDEITRCRQKQLNVLIGALNPTPVSMLPPGATPPAAGPSNLFYALTIPTTTETIICPIENLVMLAAGNLGSQYAVEPLDPALESRFTCQIELTYLGVDDETALVAERSSLPMPIARKLVLVAAETRRLWHNAELSSALDPRRLLAWANQIKPIHAAAGDDEKLIKVVIATARLTWLASVVGRDHRGMLHDGRAAGLEDFIETVWQHNGDA